MEKPTMEDVGRELGFEGDAASFRRRDAHDGLGAAGLAAGGSSVGGAGTISGCGVGTRCSSSFGASAAEMEVFVETGEAGREVSGAVDVAGVVSVSAEEGGSTGVGVGTGSGRTSVGGGEGGGEGRASAFWMTSSGGRARGEMMTPGAEEGLEGRCDQMTYSGVALAMVLGDDTLEEGEEGMEGTWGDGDECGSSARISAGSESGVGVRSDSVGTCGESGGSMESCFGSGDKGCWGCQAA